LVLSGVSAPALTRYAKHRPDVRASTGVVAGHTYKRGEEKSSI